MPCPAAPSAQTLQEVQQTARIGSRPGCTAPDRAAVRRLTIHARAPSYFLTFLAAFARWFKIELIEGRVARPTRRKWRGEKKHPSPQFFPWRSKGNSSSPPRG